MKTVHDYAKAYGNAESSVTGIRSTLWILMLFVFALFVWAATFEIDKSSLAMGEVVPTTKVKRIQHLEGGIIKKIYVQEGEFVKAGAVLMELESTISQANLKELEARLGSLEIKKIQLSSQMEGLDELDVPEALQQSFPVQVQTARQVLKINNRAIKKKIAIQKEAIVQKEAEIKEIDSQKWNLQKRLKLQRRQIEIDKTLQKDGLTNEFETLDLHKAANILEGKIAEAESRLPRLKSSLKEAKLKLDRISEEEEEEILSELEENRKQTVEFQERRKKLLDSQDRTLIRSPIEGVVKSIYYFTVGGVIPPGGSILTIVPKEDPVVIRAKLMVGDVGFVSIGQQAKLTLMSSSARRFHPMEGEIIYISADSITEPDQPPYYEIKIRPEKDYFESQDHRYPLKPGVEISAAVLIGYRTVLRYLIDPLVNSMQSAFSEA